MPATPAPRIYMDHAATTPVRPEVLEAMLPFFGPRFGNPSSTHRWGREARVALDEARERVAHTIGAVADEICFTSGGTEGDNLAVLGCWRATRHERPALVTTPIEHKAVLGAVHEAANEGGDARYLEVDQDGLVRGASVQSLVRDDVALCSVGWVNNEIGVIQDVAAIAAHTRSVGARFHTDAVQAFGKVAIDVRTVPIDYLTMSGHKIGAPKGIGALFIRRGAPLAPLLHGGTQDQSRRPGTENVAMIVGFARAAELATAEREAESEHLRAMRVALEEAIVSRIPGARIHASGATRAPHVINVSLPGADSESLLMALDLAGVACSAGSACQSESEDPSHVLAAIGVSPDLAAGALRMSLGSLTSEDDIRRVSELLPVLVEKIRRLSDATMPTAD